MPQTPLYGQGAAWLIKISLCVVFPLAGSNAMRYTLGISNGDTQMTDAALSTNNLLTIGEHIVGQLMATTDRGFVQTPTGHRAQTGAQFRPRIAHGDLGDPIRFDMPVYVSASPSDHALNPALIAAICDCVSA